jgi:hypothetical protein
MTKLRALAAGALLLALTAAEAAAEAPLQATTEDGRKVILHADGHWEFDAKDAAPGATSAPANGPSATGPKPAGTASTAARPDDRYCQGGLFGVGRRICPGDPDYNRGSLNPKLR